MISWGHNLVSQDHSFGFKFQILVLRSKFGFDIKIGQNSGFSALIVQFLGWNKHFIRKSKIIDMNYNPIKSDIIGFEAVR